jgi:hypothetical protein
LEPTNPYAPPAALEGFDHPPEITSPFRRIINIGLRLYFENFLPVAVITLLFSIPCELFQAYMQYFVIDPEDFRAPMRLQQAIENFVGIIPYGAVTALQFAALRGQPVSLWECIDKGFSAWPRLFWSRILRGILLILAFLALIIPGFYYFVRLSLVEQVAMIEHQSGLNCIKRAHQLSANHFWLLFSLLFVSYAPFLVLPAILVAPLHIFPEINHWLVYTAILVVIDLLVQLPASILVVAYHDFLHEARAATG